MEAQIVGGLGHQGIERRIAREAENIIDAVVLRRSWPLQICTSLGGLTVAVPLQVCIGVAAAHPLYEP
jgi:hypothetical protein